MTNYQFLKEYGMPDDFAQFYSDKFSDYVWIERDNSKVTFGAVFIDVGDKINALIFAHLDQAGWEFKISDRWYNEENARKVLKLLVFV